MDRLLVGGQLQSMKLALTLTVVEVETGEVVETDAAEGVTNKKPRSGKLEEKQWTSQVC
jgi:curli biogenesis system outer membrane secretion channel CsgG